MKEHVFDDYIRHLVAIGSPGTARIRRSYLCLFARWFKTDTGEELAPDAVTPSDLRAYQDHLMRNHKAGTVRTQMNTIRIWLRWSGAKVEFPKPPAVQSSSPKALDRLSLRRLIRVVERAGKPRDLALIRLLAYCGLRVSEAVSLKTADLDFGERHGIVSVRGKGNKTREVPVPPETRRAVQEWLARKPQSQWLFPGRGADGHISSRAAWDIVARYARMAGVRCHPHTLRHTAATAMLRNGTDIVTVASILGHANISTTAIYTKPTVSDMAAAMEKAESS